MSNKKNMSSHHAGTSHATSHPKSHNMNRPCLAHFKLLSSDCCSPTPRIFRVSTHKTNSMHSISSLPPSWPEPGHLSMEEDLHMALAVLKASPPPSPQKRPMHFPWSFCLPRALRLAVRRSGPQGLNKGSSFCCTCWLPVGFFLGGCSSNPPRGFCGGSAYFGRKLEAWKPGDPPEVLSSHEQNTLSRWVQSSQVRVEQQNLLIHHLYVYRVWHINIALYGCL